MKKTLLLMLVVLTIAISCKKDEPAPNLDTPVISTDVSSVSFGDLDRDEISAAMPVILSGKYLTANAIVSISADFEVSLSQDADFGTDNLTIAFADLNDASVTIYVRAVPSEGYEGPMTGDLGISSTGAESLAIALSANVALVITGELFMSEYFEQYGPEWVNTIPLDSGILGWNLNTDTIMNQANSGGGYPDVTIPNNEVYNTWYLVVPLNMQTLIVSLGLSDNSDLAITGYPSAPANARNIVLDPVDESQFWNFINPWGKCKPAAAGTGNNSSAARRFADDGYTSDVFMSSLINITALGEPITGKPNDFGIGDIIALANATSGSSNNNNIKVVALTDGAGGFNFGLIKENEGNTALLSADSYALNTTYAVVLSHEFVEGDNNDVSNLYVFAEGDEIPTSMAGLTPAVTMDASYTEGLDPLDLNIVYMRERVQAVVTPEASVTGIRVGNTWVATLFANHADALNSNDLTLNNRVLTNEGSDCIPL